MSSSPFRTLLKFSLTLSLLSPLMGLGACAPRRPEAQAADSAFQQLSAAYFEDFFKDNPSYATYAGVHRYDHELEDYSRAAVLEDRAKTLSWIARLEAIDPAGLSALEAADRELILNGLRSGLLEIDTIRNWEKNPDRYSSGVSETVFTLMSRNFAPQAERLKSVVARMRQMPAVFVAARENLSHPPRIFTEVAIEQIPGIVSFFETDVPAAFTEVKDLALLAEFKAANAEVIAQLKAYQQWLETYLLPRSDGDFRLGAEVYAKKLAYDEMVDLPLERLLEIGYADLRRNQQQFKDVAAQLDPSKSPDQVLAELGKDHPPPSELLQNFRDVMGSMRDYIVKHEILTLPTLEPPRVAETPPFMRALTFASMDTPGPFETKATEAYFNVTLPEPSWSAAETEEYMAGFNYGTIVSTAIHEAYPGHYVQFLWAPKAPSTVRKLFWANTNSEGWAHYTEQMMLDEGYGQGDLKLRLGQLQDALLRNARYIVGIEMHTGKMSYEQGIDFFVKEGYQSRANGELETRRGTADPTYLYYTLGKLQIQKLRQDYQQKKGAAFSLREFHDRFLQQGFPPIKIIRRELLGDDSPVL